MQTRIHEILRDERARYRQNFLNLLDLKKTQSTEQIKYWKKFIKRTMGSIDRLNARTNRDGSVPHEYESIKCSGDLPEDEKIEELEVVLEEIRKKYLSSTDLSRRFMVENTHVGNAADIDSNITPYQLAQKGLALVSEYRTAANNFRTHTAEQCESPPLPRQRKSVLRFTMSGPGPTEDESKKTEGADFGPNKRVKIA